MSSSTVEKSRLWISLSFLLRLVTSFLSRSNSHSQKWSEITGHTLDYYARLPALRAD